jgi:hypothetical protein
MFCCPFSGWLVSERTPLETAPALDKDFIITLRNLVARLVMFMLDGDTLFAEHFCDNKDDEGSEKASASKEINQGIAGSGKNGMDY